MWVMYWRESQTTLVKDKRYSINYGYHLVYCYFQSEGIKGSTHHGVEAVITLPVNVRCLRSFVRGYDGDVGAINATQHAWASTLCVRKTLRHFHFLLQGFRPLDVPEIYTKRVDKLMYI